MSSWATGVGTVCWCQAMLQAWTFFRKTLHLLSCFQVFPDNFMRREVQAFVVHCTFMDDGCKWKGEVRHLEVKTGSV